MLFRGDFGAIMNIDIHAPFYVTNEEYENAHGMRCRGDMRQYKR
jgi:hypothetical protein